ncbi:LysR family transcriptional regulator [Orrella sp. JC864]|uniref:LysR family transcriptional regulator n=1 Tax=Orrella sp. JC864 TaxID=3120298 RepID=UPI00300A8E8D
MNSRPSLPDLQAFCAIAAHRSFRKAADELGLSPSTLSHQMRTLEAGLGVRLLHRTTRSVALTEAGRRLLDRLGPVLCELDAALGELDELGGRPGGTLRINGSQTACRMLLAEAVPRFRERYPEVTVDLYTDGRLVDIVAEGFDAGVRLGEALQQDMIAVPVGGPIRFVAVAAPAYLARRKPPRVPQDLLAHECIRIRFPSGKPYRHWEFARRGQEANIQVDGPLVLDQVELMVEAAVRGLGIAYVPQPAAQAHLDRGELQLLLQPWCPEIAGLYLYYPGHRHVPPALRAFVEVLREIRAPGRA